MACRRHVCFVAGGEFYPGKKKADRLRNFITIGSLLVAGTIFAQAERTIQSGNEYYRKQEYKKAIEEYSKVPANDPRTGTAKFNTANALYKQDQKVEAVQFFSALGREAEAKDLKAKSYYNKAVILGQQKNLEESIEAYKNTLRIDPADREARENLQKALLDLKKKPPPPKKEEKKDPPKKEPRQQQQPRSKMSPKDAEQRLKLLQQKEKEVQQRMQQAKSRSGGGQPKDW